MLTDAEKLKKAQEESLAILLEIDRICRKEKIVYFLDAGTLLGAVRHKGFIPWDDDVDIAMTRDNFERFRKAAETKLPSHLKLVMPEDYRSGKAFYDFTPRIIDLDTARRGVSTGENYYEGKLNHLWADIFILDNLPDGEISASIVRLKQKIIYGMAMAGRYSLDLSKYSGFLRLSVGLLSTLGKAVPLKHLFRMQEILSIRYNKKETARLYYSNYQPDFLQVTLKRGWIREPVFLNFEGHELMAPEGYDEVLTEIYGDYMTLPPESERKPSHSDEIV